MKILSIFKNILHNTDLPRAEIEHTHTRAHTNKNPRKKVTETKWIAFSHRTNDAEEDETKQKTEYCLMFYDVIVSERASVCENTICCKLVDVSNRFVSDNNNLIALELVWIRCDIIHTLRKRERERNKQSLPRRLDANEMVAWVERMSIFFCVVFFYLVLFAVRSIVKKLNLHTWYAKNDEIVEAREFNYEQSWLLSVREMRCTQ